MPRTSSQFFYTLTRALVLTLVMLYLLMVADAQVRSSTNYQIQSDSINVGGGFSSSTSYTQESTFGEVATGPSDSTSFSLRAGYQQMQEIYISLSTTGDVTMSPALPGLSGGTANGSSTVTVITDNVAGYQLTLTAEGEPAMQSGVGTIADYDAGAEPDFSFLIGSSDAHFGFSPQGVDVVPAFLDDGASICGTGSSNTALACWDGLATTSTVVAEGTDSNHPSGATTTINFRVGIGGNAAVTAGVYTATTTVTALPL